MEDIQYVQISSTINITVTNGLTAVDKTDKANVSENKFNVQETWSKNSVSIKKGVGNYPKVICDWETVKVLQANKILTIGQDVPAKEVTEEEASNASKLATALSQAKAEATDVAEDTGRKGKHKTADDAAAAE